MDKGLVSKADKSVSKKRLKRAFYQWMKDLSANLTSLSVKSD
ncbi:hypothetical protein LMG8526_0582 [Lactococcus lactis subsp. lactis]|nr:hypothetical protein [Lactococcus lactis]KSU12601.1 hypothetical protein LMG8526_0582 [Lactococcus lactis subsp. lactis]